MRAYLRGILTASSFLLSFLLLSIPVHAEETGRWIQQVPSVTTANLRGVSFVNSSVGVVVGAGGTIFWTNDGGNTWTAQTSGTSQDLNEVVLVNMTTGFVVGNGGTILRTTNSGTTWTVQSSGVTGDLNDVSFASEDRGWVVGNNGVILNTITAGVTWGAQTSGTSQPLRAVYFVDGNTGYAVGGANGNYPILRTTSGGLTWETIYNNVLFTPLSVHFINQSIGWVGGANGKVLKTTDGGATWTNAQSGLNAAGWYGIRFISESTGWVAGGGQIFKTTNGGSSWQIEVPIGAPSQTLHDIAMVSSGAGWIVGDGGTLLHYFVADSSALPDFTVESPVLTADRLTYIWKNQGRGDNTVGFINSHQWVRADGSPTTPPPFPPAMAHSNVRAGISIVFNSDTTLFAEAIDNYISNPPADAVALCIILDKNNQQPETNETNNTIAIARPGVSLSSPLPSCPQPSSQIPDLHIGPIVRVPDTPTDGSPFTLRVGVQNLGTGVAGASTLSARLDLGNNGAHIGTDPYGVFDEVLPARSIGTIAPGATSATVEWSWSAWPTGGPHRIVLCVDSGGVVAESDENNNCSVVVLISGPAAALLPDLAIESVGFETGTTIPTVTVKNQGTADSSITTPAPVVMLEWLNADGVRVGNAENQGVVDLEPGGRALMSFDTVVAVPLGVARLRVTVDANNTEPESNETNNIGIGDILLPDLIVQSVTFSTSRVPTVIVRNQGSAPALSRLPPSTPRVAYLWLTLDGAAVNTGGEFGALPPNLGVNDTYTLPGGTLSPPTGAARLRITIDSSNLTGELNESNNVWEGTIPPASTQVSEPESARDTTLPSAPSNVRRTSAATDTTPTFTWNPATDNVAIDRYVAQILSQGGGELGIPATNVGTATTYTVPSAYALTPGTTYTFWITTWDMSANRATEFGYLLFTIEAQAGSITETREAVMPVNTPPAPAPTAVPVAVVIHDPSKLDDLVSALGATRTQSEEAKYLPLIKSDAIAFKVGLTAEQEAAITNFVTYGASDKTVKLGAGERRAVVRDYLETVGRGNVNWEDVERVTKGEKPVARNLGKEQAQVSAALKLFERIYGHRPNFSVAEEDLAWNTLLYRIRFSRDLEKEQYGVKEFRAVFKRLPATPLDWSTVRALGYVIRMDSDNDGLTDIRETRLGTDPNNPDTDGDGYLDGVEVNQGYNPKG